MMISARQPAALRVAIITVLILNLSNILGQAGADRISDKIYLALQSNHYCSRRLNATHQVGCQSELGGNMGVIWIVEQHDDLDHILKTGPTPPYIAVLYKDYYSRDSILSFKSHPGRVSGVVFLDKNHDDSKSRSSPFSPDDISPNRYSGLYVNDTQFSGHAWQKVSPISGLLYEDIPFPIFLINETKSTDDIELCFKNNNVIMTQQDARPDTGTPLEARRTQATYPLCAIQLDSFMMAAKDSHFCLNSHFMIDEILQSNSPRCYTVQNHNIFAYFKPAIGPLHPINDSDICKPDTASQQSVVLLMAKLSSLSMFTEMSPGADSTISSIITLLAIAEALGRVKNSTDVMKSKRNLAFALLDSEPFDYTGSSTMVHSMDSDLFPSASRYSTNYSSMPALQNVKLSSLDYIINLDQMANYPTSESLHFHTDPRDSSNEKLDRIYGIMNRIASNENIKLERGQADLPLPPTSVHEFIKHSRNSEANKPAGLVLSNYGKTYSNLVYNSIYDDSHNIYQASKSKLVQHLSGVSRVIAKTLYEITFESKKSDDVTIDNNLIDDLLDCYLIHANCTLFTRACLAGQKMPEGPIPTYKDPTKRSDDMNGVITYNLLVYFIGDKIKEYSKTKCLEENVHSITYNYQYINDKDEPIEEPTDTSGICVRSQVFMLPPDSPAYSITEDEITIDTNYPAWTVSLSSIRNPVRLYLIPSPVSQWLLLALGVTITVASFFLVRIARDNIASSKLPSDSQVATST